MDDPVPDLVREPASSTSSGPEVSPNGRGWPIGLAQATGISLLGLLLIRARPPT